MHGLEAARGSRGLVSGAAEPCLPVQQPRRLEDEAARIARSAVVVQTPGADSFSWGDMQVATLGGGRAEHHLSQGVDHYTSEARRRACSWEPAPSDSA